MAHLNKESLEELRALLEEEQVTLEEELAEHGQVMNDAGEWEATSSGLSGEEADPSDAADQIEELVTNVPLVKELAERLRDIVDALDKMNKGTYGVCEVGGEEIPLKRLMVNPAARACITHAV